MAFIIHELSFFLMFKITIATKECLYSKNFTLTIRTTFCSVMIDRAGYTPAVRFHPTHDMMPAIAIDECTHSPKNRLPVTCIICKIYCACLGRICTCSTFHIVGTSTPQQRCETSYVFSNCFCSHKHDCIFCTQNCLFSGAIAYADNIH